MLQFLTIIIFADKHKACTTITYFTDALICQFTKTNNLIFLISLSYFYLSLFGAFMLANHLFSITIYGTTLFTYRARVLTDHCKSTKSRYLHQLRAIQTKQQFSEYHLFILNLRKFLLLNFTRNLRLHLINMLAIISSLIKPQNSRYSHYQFDRSNSFFSKSSKVNFAIIKLRFNRKIIYNIILCSY